MRCLHPLNVSPYKNIKKFIQVPCGRCPNCVKTKRDALAFRLDAEHNSKDNLFSLFVTLTYSDSYLPTSVNDVTGEEFNYLSSDDIHNFFKYLRKIGRLYDFRFRYFLCGEYGDLFGRPHYHAIFFVKSINHREPFEQVKALITRAWYRGYVSVQLPKNGFRAFNYVTKYVIKNSAFELNDHYKNNKPFLRMSHFIGLSNVINHSFSPTSKLLFSDSHDRVHILPRYYHRYIFNDIQLWQHQFYSKMFVTDQSIERCKRYCFSDYQLSEYDWNLRVYESYINIRKSNSLITDQFYSHSYEYL